MTGKTIGAEALVRREHPQCGLLLPSEFVPLAEETGTIVPIGQWVLEACPLAHVWQEQYPGDPPLIMCVNPYSRQFQHDPLVEDIARALRVPRALSDGLGEVDRSVVNGFGEGAEEKASCPVLLTLPKS